MRSTACVEVVDAYDLHFMAILIQDKTEDTKRRQK